MFGFNLFSCTFLSTNYQGRITRHAKYAIAMAWDPPRQGGPVAARIFFYTSISLVIVTLFACCFLKISTFSSSDLTEVTVTREAGESQPSSGKVHEL